MNTFPPGMMELLQKMSARMDTLKMGAPNNNINSTPSTTTLKLQIGDTTKNAMLELASIFNRVAPLPKPQLPPPSIVANPTNICVAPRKTVHFNIPSIKNPIASLCVNNDYPRVDASPPRVVITPHHSTPPPYSVTPRTQRAGMIPPCVDTPHPLTLSLFYVE